MNWHRASVRGPPHTVMSGQDSGGPVDQGRATLRGSGAYIEAPGSRYLDDGVAIDHILAAANYRPVHREPFDFFGFVTLSLAIGALQMLLDRGELKDWFGSTEIWIAATVAGLGFYLFVVHTVTATDRSFLNRDLLKDGKFRSRHHPDVLCRYHSQRDLSVGPDDATGRKLLGLPNPSLVGNSAKPTGT
jgi:hypothetical protein